MDWINTIGAVGTILMGCMGLFLPSKAEAFTGLKPTTVEARGEFRGTFGMAFILLGLVPLATQNPYAYVTVGLCWVGAALGRAVSIFAESGHTPKNWAGVVFEALFAICLLAGQPFGEILENVSLMN